MNHLLGQFHNFHRLAHVQHEHIATLAHGAGLNYQLRGLGNGHEVAGDLGVGDGKRAARLDLLVEQWNHRPR
ncbi:hypothetical protein D3C75_1256300 [compost metagenome]